MNSVATSDVSFVFSELFDRLDRMEARMTSLEKYLHEDMPYAVARQVIEALARNQASPETNDPTNVRRPSRKAPNPNP